MKIVTFFSALLLTACVTINIYFPAAAAEEVADEIIQEIQGVQGNDTVSLTPVSKVSGLQLVVYQLIDQSLNILISPAHAGANLSVNTAEIRKIRAQMQTRFGSLQAFYSKGFIGIQKTGLLTSRGSASLKDRNKIKKLVVAENSDRQRLYQAIANANGHPEWLNQIKSTFAARWIGNAQAGWWYQSSNGSWKQK